LPFTYRHCRMSKAKKIYWLLSFFVVLIVLAAVGAGPVMSNVEQPQYTTVDSEGSIEIREYAPMIEAEVDVKGSRSAAIRKGFRSIAAYIFGANKPRVKIEMTAPVEQQSQKIGLTAPVTQQSNDGNWSVRFIMPKIWTMQTLPKPADSRVKLVPMPARRMLAIKFSGRATDRAIAQKTSELRQFGLKRKINVEGEPLLAFYNPPWTLPFLRRNEIMLEIGAK
jgi:hypothetical protein